MKYMPHFVHLLDGSLGMRAIPRKPTKGGMVEKIMKYRRRAFTRNNADRDEVQHGEGATWDLKKNYL